jgi:thiol:disulfide interchange protein DsbD
MKTRNILFLLLVAATAQLAIAAHRSAAAELITSPAQAPQVTRNISGGVIPPDEAFAFSAFVEADGHLVLSWEMPPSIYLYRKSLSVATADGTALELVLPESTSVTDEYFGASDVYFGRVLARVPVSALGAAPGATVELQLVYQGCLQDVYCYPPQHKTVSVLLPD